MGVCPRRIMSRNSSSSLAMERSIDASGRMRPNCWQARQRRSAEYLPYRILHDGVTVIFGLVIVRDDEDFLT